ncbi:MAG: cupredoxin domain-containing protein [Candidatus Pacebacteria bacterium]|nr:cupredoxin domain-containing protein [Candidatus Paceibacterota bacterium]
MKIDKNSIIYAVVAVLIIGGIIYLATSKSSVPGTPADEAGTTGTTNSAANTGFKGPTSPPPSIPTTSTKKSTATTATSNTPVAGDTVTIKNGVFTPKVLIAQMGVPVTWKNEDSTYYQVTSDLNDFVGSVMTKDSTYSHTFLTKGTFNYHCVGHSDMKGTIIVQ